MSLKSKNGAILAMVMGFMLVFMLAGIAAVYFSGMQTEGGQREVFSTQAFWIAEAGIERALSHVATTPIFCPTEPQLFGEGSYQVCVTPKPGSTNHWIIDSTGNVTGFNRHIQAETGPNVVNALTTTGTVTAPGGIEDNVSGTVASGPTVTLSFQDIFGVSESVMQSKATLVVTGTNVVIPSGITGITWVNGNCSNISGNWTGSGILVINGDISFEGGTFYGVIWINGAVAKINGNDIVHGAIFINDPNRKDTKINGSAGIAYDSASIDAAFGSLDGYPSAYRHIISWREVD